MALAAAVTFRPSVTAYCTVCNKQGTHGIPAANEMLDTLSTTKAET